MVWISCLHQFHLSQVPWKCSLTGQPEWMVYTQWQSMLQLQNFELGKLQPFKVVTRKPTQILPWRERVFVTLIRKQICPLPKREPLPLACKATLQISLEVFSKNIVTSGNIMENCFPVDTAAVWNPPLSDTYMAFSLILFRSLIKCHLSDHPIAPASPFLCGLGSVWHMNLLLDWLPALLKCKLHGVQKFVVFTVDSTAPGLVNDRVGDH